MGKRIVVCADGTWNRPEKNPKKDFPTNVLKLARAIKPVGSDQTPQQVFYDWGIGSYHDSLIGGATGRGINKNIMDDYRYIVQNYSPGDEIYLFGFSRGAYTIRCLCGLINNCGIIKRKDAKEIQKAFNFYKTGGSAKKPNGPKSREFRARYSHSESSRQVKFVGVWDTVGAMGIPISFLGLFDKKDEFYDTKIGTNVIIARHAMAIDELREDFEPTTWTPNGEMDLQQVWFAGAHSNIGGSYKPDKDGSLASDYALAWMIKEAHQAGLAVEPHIKQRLTQNPTTKLTESRSKWYKLKAKNFRPIDHKKGPVLIHESVKQRYDLDGDYRPKNLKEYLEDNHDRWPSPLVR